MASDSNSGESKTKICKYCKSEIPADAKICPNCRKKQSGGWLKWVIIAVVVLAIIGAASGGSDEPKKVQTADTGSASTETSKASATDDKAKASDTDQSASAETAKKDDSAKEGAKKESTTFGIGDTADFDGVQVKLSSAVLSNGDGQLAKPDDGKYFLGLIFDIDNQSSDDIAVSSAVSFEAYCDDYSLTQDVFGYQAPEWDGISQLDGDVAAGKKMNGVICFQVPKDFKTFEISYAPSFWNNKKVTFTMTKDDIDSSAVE